MVHSEAFHFCRSGSACRPSYSMCGPLVGERAAALLLLLVRGARHGPAEPAPRRRLVPPLLCKRGCRLRGPRQHRGVGVGRDPGVLQHLLQRHAVLGVLHQQLRRGRSGCMGTSMERGG